MARRKSVLQRLRWDRLAMTGAVMVAFICLLVTCNKNNEKPTPASNAEQTTTTAATIPPELVDKPMAVFLSPSNQTDNAYAGSDTETEATVMRAIAEVAKRELEAKGVEVYMAAPEDSLETKVNTANAKRVGTYVAIHSNAGGSSGTGSGTEIYYNPDTKGSRILAKNVYSEVASLTPTDDRDMHPGTGGENRELYEIIHPEMACCLVEVEFHDQTNLAAWIMDNKTEIGKAIAAGIQLYQAGLTPAATTTTGVAEGTTTDATT